jgi:hypothetical protein
MGTVTLEATRMWRPGMGVNYAPACAADFRLVRQPSSPMTPRPEAKNGSAAGRGTAAGDTLNVPKNSVIWEDITVLDAGTGALPIG